jgi:hypothetical protein
MMEEENTVEEEILVVDDEELENDGSDPVVKQEQPPLTLEGLAQGVQAALSNLVGSFDVALKTIREDIDSIKRFEGKQEGMLLAKLEEFNKRIENTKTRLGNVEKLVKLHNHK